MCEIIQFPTSARIHVQTAVPFCGVIDIYSGKNGTVGLDACVPSKLAWEMIADIMPGMVSLFDNGEGTTGFDTQIPAHAAEKVLAAAQRAGVSIRRQDIAS